jgi:aspartate aminotransferase
MTAVRLSPYVKTLAPSATIAAAAKAKELKAKGVHVYDFTLGEPDFNTPEHIQKAAIAAMSSGKTHYTQSGGIPELKTAICQAYQRDYNLAFTPAQITVSNGAKHALHNVITTLCQPGDEVIIPAPYWVSYRALVELTGATAKVIQTTPESGFCLQPEQLEKAITPYTRMIMLNSPSNPTGVVYPPELLEKLCNIAVSKNIWILSDEIYEKLIYPPSKFVSVASFSEAVKQRTIIISGMSKAYAMTGWRIGWSIAPTEINKAIDNLQSQETSNPCSISQYASIAALTENQQTVEDMRVEFEKRRAYVLDRFKKIPGVSFVEPGGAFYVFFDVSSYFGKTLQGGKVVHNASDFCTTLLETAHVALVTGDAFEAPGYVRMSFATSIEQLDQGLTRLAAFLNPTK